ncbi:MAG: 50S ribosomal protein L23 [Mycoplasma sp.]|nr:50S ribosomal protein L23 [Mycoplasma sp.]
MNINEIIKKPVLTEKTYKQMADGAYTFVVDKRAKKNQIKRAVEQIFDVKIGKVNTQVVRRKEKRVGRFSGLLAGYKKAVVYLLDGYSINFFPEEAAASVNQAPSKPKEEKVAKPKVKSEKETALEAKIAEKIKSKETAKNVEKTNSTENNDDTKKEVTKAKNVIKVEGESK